MRDIEININDSDQRLDRFLQKIFPRASKSLLQKHIRKKKIKVNRKKVTADAILKEGDLVNIFVYDEILEKWEEEKKEVKSRLKVDIIYEDENILIFDKPKNVLCHAASKRDYGNNLVDYMVDYLIVKGEYIPRNEKTFRPAIVNRIDYNTSGLVLGAKNKKSLLSLNKAIKDDKITKVYRALALGNLEGDFKIDKPLYKNSRNIVKVVDRSNEGEVTNNNITRYSQALKGAKKSGEDLKYKESLTLGKVLFHNENYTYIEIILKTGRTHQIRSHMASIGHSLVGDRKYGDARKNQIIKEKYNIVSQMLLAYKLKFSEIEDLQYLKNREFTSSFIDEFENTVEKIVEERL